MRGHRVRIWNQGGLWVSRCEECEANGRDSAVSDRRWTVVLERACLHHEASKIYGAYASGARWHDWIDDLRKLGSAW